MFYQKRDNRKTKSSIKEKQSIWLLIIKVWGISSLGFTDENMDRKKNAKNEESEHCKTQEKQKWVFG